MKKLAILPAVALIAASTLMSGEAEARNRRNNAGAAIAAGVVGAVVGGLLASQAHAAPTYGYGYSAYDYPQAPVGYDYAPEYRSTRVVRSYDDAPDYGYRPVPTYRSVTYRKTIIERTYRAPAFGYDGDYGW